MHPVKNPFVPLIVAALAWPGGAHAQALPAGPTAAAVAPRSPLPEQVVVIEDEGARIEETRRRGQVVHVQVQSKLSGARSYGITLKPSAEPASQQRGTAGRSAWQVLRF